MYAMRSGYQINELSVMIQNILHRWCSEKIHGIYIYMGIMTLVTTWANQPV